MYFYSYQEICADGVVITSYSEKNSNIMLLNNIFKLLRNVLVKRQIAMATRSGKRGSNESTFMVL